jgi:cyclopropane fatty-acyl-phospholipid synthase-like methyltransferase
VTLHATIQDVTAHFEGKTQAILQRYGPGPRVHYHAGLVDDPPAPDAPAQVLRRQLVEAQERILHYASEVWGSSASLRGEILDVGCGLGGGSIFLAQEFGAQVTAVTCVPSHADWVARFAAHAGVETRVFPVVCDALEVHGENRFDAAVAVDSSCYLPRKKWFQRLATLLRPGGRVFIMDCFLGHPQYQEQFDRYWRTRVGSVEEYLVAAAQAGLEAESVEDISHRTRHFWTTTLKLIQAEGKDVQLNSTEAIRYDASLRAHSLVRQGLSDKGLRYALISFCKTS